MLISLGEESFGGLKETMSHGKQHGSLGLCGAKWSVYITRRNHRSEY